MVLSLSQNESTGSGRRNEESWRRCPARCRCKVQLATRNSLLVGSLRACYLARGDVHAMMKGMMRPFHSSRNWFCMIAETWRGARGSDIPHGDYSPEEDWGAGLQRELAQTQMRSRVGDKQRIEPKNTFRGTYS
jgi:hypothetical protein